MDARDRNEISESRRQRKAKESRRKQPRKSDRRVRVIANESRHFGVPLCDFRLRILQKTEWRLLIFLAHELLASTQIEIDAMLHGRLPSSSVEATTSCDMGPGPRALNA